MCDHGTMYSIPHRVGSPAIGYVTELMGKKQLALAQYKKSLKLNPDSTETQRAITRLNSK